jgi:predicted nucleotidyltransferase
MTRSPRLDLPADHRRIVLDIFHAHLPRSARVWVFGSRASGRARRYSDLDLAIDAGRRLTLDEIAQLAEAFSDSDLPYKVDLADWHDIDDRWRRTIMAERMALAGAEPDDPVVSSYRSHRSRASAAAADRRDRGPVHRGRH